MLSVDAFVFSFDDVFSYKVVDLRGISPAVRLPLEAVSNLLIAVRGFAGDDEPLIGNKVLYSFDSN